MLTSFIDPKQYGGYFAFLLSSVIVLYDRLHELQTLQFLVGILILACASLMIINDNPGITVLMVAFFLQGVSTYVIQTMGSTSNTKSQAPP